MEFNPDFILISAGFDAHQFDHLHNSSDTTINEFDYEWVTQQLIKVANTCCDGKIVSILEGGYSTKSGPISPLAQSVGHHVRALLKADSVGIPDVEKYIEQQKLERIILKKRRKVFDEDLNPYSFMVMRPKRQKT